MLRVGCLSMYSVGMSKRVFAAEATYAAAARGLGWAVPKWVAAFRCWPHVGIDVARGLRSGGCF